MTDLFFDVETIPDQRPGALEEHVKIIHPPGNIKKTESIEKWLAESGPQAALDSWKKTALTGIAGEICSIAWAFDDELVTGYCRTIDNETERFVLLEFFEAIESRIRTGEGSHPRMQFIGHNVMEFDLRFLFHRCVILNIQPPVRLPVDSRHDSGRVYDTMKAWAGFRGYEKQDRIVNALGIDFKAPDDITEIDGSMIWNLYQAGMTQTILTYNKLDVEKVRAMYKRLTWQ